MAVVIRAAVCLTLAVALCPTLVAALCPTLAAACRISVAAHRVQKVVDSTSAVLVTTPVAEKWVVLAASNLAALKVLAVVAKKDLVVNAPLAMKVGAVSAPSAAKASAEKVVTRAPVRKAAAATKLSVGNAKARMKDSPVNVPLQMKMYAASASAVTKDLAEAAKPTAVKDSQTDAKVLVAVRREELAHLVAPHDRQFPAKAASLTKVLPALEAGLQDGCIVILAITILPAI